MVLETTGISYPTPSLLVILSGPSGVGKDAVLAQMKKLQRPHHFAMTATTRPKRPAEEDGVDYLFLTPDQFDEMLLREEFLEWAQVYGNRYGVPKAPIQKAISNGQNVIVKIDVQGAATIKRMAPECVSIFLAPPSMEELERRLSQRMTERTPDLILRLKTARAEMGHQPSFDYVVVNHDGALDATVAAIESIILAEQSIERTYPTDL